MKKVEKIRINQNKLDKNSKKTKKWLSGRKIRKK